MEAWVLYAGMALCVFSLRAIARHHWFRLTRPTRSAVDAVIGHRIAREDGHATYATIYRFHAEDGPHEVVDPVYTACRTPDHGTHRVLAWPHGHPDLARPPRPLLWLAIYALLIGLFGVLAATALGYMPG